MMEVVGLRSMEAVAWLRVARVSQIEAGAQRPPTRLYPAHGYTASNTRKALTSNTSYFGNKNSYQVYHHNKFILKDDSNRWLSYVIALE